MEDTLNNNPPAIPVADDPVVAPDPDGSTPIKGSEFEEDTLAPSDLDARWTRWKCGVCNHLHESSKPLKTCPRCGNADPDKFIDVD